MVSVRSCILCLLVVPSLTTSAGRKPVVLVPGLVASGLEVKATDSPMPHWWCKSNSKDFYRIWLEVKELLPEQKDCLEAALELKYDPATDSYSNHAGIQLRPIDWGGIDGVSYADPGVSYTTAYADIIAALTQKTGPGYTVNTDLFGAPYDWRLAGDAHARVTNGVGGFYIQLKALVESAVKKNDGRPAVIISHSLGTPTIHHFFHTFVSEEWRASHIDSWIAMSGPWAGGIAQAESYLGGYTFGLPLPHDYIRQVQVNASSGVFISPLANVFKDPIISTPSRNYTAADLPMIVETIGEGAGGAATAALFRNESLNLTKLQRAATKVPMHVWYSYGTKTPEHFIYDEDLSLGFDKKPSKVILGDGDGVVNLLSSQQPFFWPDVPSSPVRIRNFSGISHQDMLMDKKIIAAIMEVLGVQMPAADTAPADIPSIVI
eukprot:gnl/TRDRNA2_/TRDRNA2_63283_c0_seq1.p1 gnl/TRDRNA2_/TRDRNA2_63283_c0~~gnl/TRDRNA2_/TRDRNA2_63283_c0_seq1.p1  ORF type:complete len:446 (-),score=67.18 gnl/TRDRNA2_/TRDRNA2_63283_c0_seq1:35-1336(-)